MCVDHRGLGRASSGGAYVTAKVFLTPDAKRQRLCRKRQREGGLLLKVEGKPELVSAFIARGWLSADAAQDRRVVAEAVEALLDCWVRGNLSDEAMT